MLRKDSNRCGHSFAMMDPSSSGVDGLIERSYDYICPQTTNRSSDGGWILSPYFWLLMHLVSSEKWWNDDMRARSEGTSWKHLLSSVNTCYFWCWLWTQCDEDINCYRFIEIESNTKQSWLFQAEHCYDLTCCAVRALMWTSVIHWQI